MQTKSIYLGQAGLLCVLLLEIIQILSLQSCSMDQVQMIVLVVFEVESTPPQFDVALVVQMILDLHYAFLELSCDDVRDVYVDLAYS